MLTEFLYTNNWAIWIETRLMLTVLCKGALVGVIFKVIQHILCTHSMSSLDNLIMAYIQGRNI